jgi:RNA 2',3'-cyclic 3'-phosphodiesterase
MRIFIAFDIPGEIRERLKQYVDSVRLFAPDVRWIRPESLHVTLKFVGEVSDKKVEEIRGALARVHANSFDVTFKEVGFFPRPASARVFWAGVHSSPALSELASAIDAELEALGVAREKRIFQPHLTLAKAAQSGGGHPFSLLRQRLNPDEPPHFGTMSAQAFFLYRSEIMRGGARYTRLERFPLES